MSQIAHLLLKKKSTWSEEDETALGDTLWAIEQAKTVAKNESEMGNIWYAERWLKSLEDRVGCEANYTTTKEWKPSDEQMEVLLSEVTAWSKGCSKQKVLESLYQDLKKLK